jgi:hypothetical protein
MNLYEYCEFIQHLDYPGPFLLIIYGNNEVFITINIVLQYLVGSSLLRKILPIIITDDHNFTSLSTETKIKIINYIIN